MNVGQIVRFRYEGGTYPGTIRRVRIENWGPNHIEGYDLSLVGHPYRRFRRMNMYNAVVEDANTQTQST